MKKAKKTGGAIAYLNALSRSYIPPFKRGIWEILPIFLCGFISFLAIYQTRAPYGTADRLDFTVLVFLFALVEFITCALIVSVSRHKPNLQSLFPMTRRKKLILRLASGFILSLFWYLIILAALFLLLLIPFLLGGIFINLWIGIEFYFELYGDIFTKTDGLGYAFMAFWLVLTYGAGILCGSVKSNKLRWAVAGGYSLIAVIITLLAVNLLDGNTNFVLRNTVIQNFNCLPLAWLWVTVLAITAVGLSVFAVFYAVKQDKEVDF